MGVTENIEDAKSILKICKQFMKYLRRSNIIVSIVVCTFISFGCIIIDLMPWWILKFRVFINAVYMRVSYDVMADAWAITDDRYAFAVLMATFIDMLAAGAVCYIILQTKSTKLWYRKLGCCMISTYTIIAYVYIIILRYSVDLYRRFWWFYAGQIVYMILGIVITVYKNPNEQRHVVESKKKHKGKKKD